MITTCPRCTGDYRFWTHLVLGDLRRLNDRGQPLCYGCTYYLDCMDKGVKPEE